MHIKNNPGNDTTDKAAALPNYTFSAPRQWLAVSAPRQWLAVSALRQWLAVDAVKIVITSTRHHRRLTLVVVPATGRLEIQPRCWGQNMSSCPCQYQGQEIR